MIIIINNNEMCYAVKAVIFFPPCWIKKPFSGLCVIRGMESISGSFRMKGTNKKCDMNNHSVNHSIKYSVTEHL